MVANEEKLVKMLKYVSEHNDFYKNRIKEYGITNPQDITQWPVLTRKELQENRYNMFSDGYKMKHTSKLLHRQYSSGLSGIPVNVYWDIGYYHQSVLSLWRKRAVYYSVLPKDKMIKFTLVAFGSNYTEKKVYTRKENDNIISISRSCLQNENDYREVIKIINEFAPTWIYIQPYILRKLLISYKNFGIFPPKSIRYIESVGELLSSKLKNDASDFFSVPIANMYGSEEHNGIAFECPYHNMHILEDNVYVECKSGDTISMFGEGESIITNLYNKVMPIIRYNQGDIITIEKLEQPCPCGDKSPIVGIIKGRTHDCITVDGGEINSFTLLEVIDEVNNIFSDPITEFKYIYSISRKKLICYISIHPEIAAWKPRIAKQIEETLWTKLPKDIDIIFEVTDMVSIGSTYKKFKILEFED